MKYEPIKESIIIDASNIAYNGLQTPKFSNLKIVREQLEVTQNRLIFIADYKLYFILKKNDINFSKDEYHQWKDQELLIESPRDVSADELILELACNMKEESPKIISNDLFKQFKDNSNYEWIMNNRVSFRIVNSQLFLFKKYNGEHNTSLNESISIKITN